MRPRNRIEERVVALSGGLKGLTERQRLWAEDNCFERVGFYCKGEVWCSRCGGVHERTVNRLCVSVVGDECVCPHCGARLKVKISRCRRVSERWYFTVVTTCREFQVFRHFIMERSIYRASDAPVGENGPYCFIREAVQNWVSEDGQEFVVARPCRPLAHVYDAWDFDRPMELRSRRRCGWSYGPDKYDVNADFVYPVRRVLPKLRRNGFTFRCRRLSGSRLAVMLLTDNVAEMLVKSGQYDLLYAKAVRGIPMEVLPSVNICNRNGYRVRDASLWIDYIGLLLHFGMDARNAKYVCPADVLAEHDRLMRRRSREIERQKRLERMREVQAWEDAYARDKGCFFGVCFGNEDIVVRVVRSVAEMAEEGEVMHHCVFAMEYYKRFESLILSARDRAGNRIETVEVNLGSFKVVQSRGVCNSVSAKHDEIVRLVEQNMGLIRRAMLNFKK